MELKGYYATRRHDDHFESRVYHAAALPVVHLGTAIGDPIHRDDGVAHMRVNPGADAGHKQLVDLIKQKLSHSGAEQEKEQFIGFTLQKGHHSDTRSNRYSMTSRGSNTPTFGGRMVEGEPVTDYYPSLAWRNAIIEACDRLLELEHDLRQQGALEFTIASLGSAGHRDLAWINIRDRYWPQGHASATPSALDRFRATEDGSGGEEDEWDGDADGYDGEKPW
jgi:hypothetical protein